MLVLAIVDIRGDRMNNSWATLDIHHNVQGLVPGGNDGNDAFGVNDLHKLQQQPQSWSPGMSSSSSSRSSLTCWPPGRSSCFACVAICPGHPPDFLRHQTLEFPDDGDDDYNGANHTPTILLK